MIWTIILLIQAAILYCILTHRKRYKTDPPLDKGIIPWLGHALEFGKDAFKFLARMKKKHGDIFTVRVAGRYVTVLLDPFSYDLVLTDRDSLDFSQYATVLMDRIFQLKLPHHMQNQSKVIMKKHFLGMNLIGLNTSIGRHLHNLMKAELSVNQKDWKEEGLFNFSYSLLFKAGYLTLFGEQNNNVTDPSKIYKEYRTFDGLLTKLARGTLKPEEKKLSQSVRQRLCALLSPVGGGEEDSGAGSWVHSYRRMLQDEGVDHDTQNKALLMQLWASQGNAGPAAFWLLGFLLTNPDAMTAVKKEFRGISQTSETCLFNVKTPVFDSALEETLRLTAAPFITREVVREKTIHMSDGQEYRLRKGDRLCLFPLLSPQMDPDVHSEPQIFKHDRFLNQDGSPKTDFYKRGRMLKYYTMPWGAGVNGCVGRQLAIHSIRLFVYMVLTKYDIELCDRNAHMPDVNTSRYGFGVLQPEGELQVRYKLKQ
ncbi:unnamed protein product [Knipowitschia caucasica]